MESEYMRKLFATALTAALVFSSFLFLTGVEAGAADDLEVRYLEEPVGTPPPRVNTPYDIIVGWKNLGDTDTYNATIRLFLDCDQTTLADESAAITMEPGETGSVTLSITFTEASSETCYSATIYYASTNYGEFENYIIVEPETGDADLWVNIVMEGNQAAQGQEVDVIFEYGNDGDVSTLNPVTIMAYFDPLDDNFSNYFEPAPLTFDFMSPPPSRCTPRS